MARRRGHRCADRFEPSAGPPGDAGAERRRAHRKLAPGSAGVRRTRPPAPRCVTLDSMFRRLLSVLPLCACIAVGAAFVAGVRAPLLARSEQPAVHEQLSFLLSPRWSVAFSL